MPENTANIERVRALAADGFTQTEIAAELGISQSRVSRLLTGAGQAAVENGPAVRAVNRVARSLGKVSPDVAARVELARALAQKLDWTTAANTGSAALAASSVAKELRALLDELRQSASFDELREALLASDDD
jgi:DNA-binding transcriptional regulator LsrR (DeoR family)